MSSVDEAVRTIREMKPRNVVVMTGAGVSADSGIPTFRGARGLWREINPETSGVSSSCTFAIPARAAEATPPIVEALLEVRK